MTRIFRSVTFVLALATAGLGVGALAWTSGGTAAAQSGGFTPLPPGWELCVLEGVSAPASANNVADLDEWQAAEGGSTNNTAAFNPFNTGRMTDVTGAAIPGAVSANGFPAFPTWAAGCAATVATLFQPNMWVITAALRALLCQCHRDHTGQPGPRCARLVRTRRLRQRELGSAVLPKVHRHGDGRSEHAGHPRSRARSIGVQGGRGPGSVRRGVAQAPRICSQRVREQRAVFRRPLGE